MEKILKDYAIRIEETFGKTVVVEGCPSLEDAIEFVKKSIQDVRIEMDRVDDFLDRNVFPAEHFTDGTEKGEIVEGQNVSWYETYEYADKNLAYCLACFKNEELLYKLKTATKLEAVKHMQKDAIKIVNENTDKKQSIMIDVEMAAVSIEDEAVTYRWDVSNILPRQTIAYSA